VKKNYDLYITIFLDNKKAVEAYTFYDYVTAEDSLEVKKEKFDYFINSLIEREEFNQIFSIQYTSSERDSLSKILKNLDIVLYIQCLFAFDEMNIALQEYNSYLLQDKQRCQEIDLLIK